MHLALIVVLASVLAAAAAAMATTMPAPAYRGVERLLDGQWRGYVTNNKGDKFMVGRFDTAEAAALAHDRAIVALVGPAACSEAFNFRAGFSDTELRFLRGQHTPGRADAIIALIGNQAGAAYEAQFTRFAEHAYDAYMDLEFAFDVMSFRLAHRDDMLHRCCKKMAAAVGPAAVRDFEREAFLEAAKNKATSEDWVRSFHQWRQRLGPTFEDENRWPRLVPPIDDVDVGDNFAGNELIYLPHGSWYVDEMIKFS